GIAGLLKVLLALKNKKLPPLVHFKEQNPYIQIEDSPFYFVKEAQEWKTDNNQPRRAGVSSFGFGGANAHVVVEEYLAENETPSDSTSQNNLILLSAKSPEQLNEKAKQLHHFIEQNRSLPLTPLAYTLQTGRDSMEYRFAVVVTTIEELTHQLQSFIQKEGGTYSTGQVARQSNNRLQFGDYEEDQEYLKKMIENRRLKRVAQLWIEGIEFDWDLFYDQKPTRISLPSYPFKKERYWWTPPAEKA
ncbi:MAG: type I polyketide synthase, partial [Simkania sp.]|nr:type I polyketide synthase [Simkania sp.]